MDSSHAAGARHRSPPSTVRPESSREPGEAEPSRPDPRVAQCHNHHHRRSDRDHQPHDLYLPTPAYPPPQPVRRPMHSTAGSKSLDAATTTQTPPGGAQPSQQSRAAYHIEKFDPDNRFSLMSLHSAAFYALFLF
ncbi:hypothetical protein CFC21_083412 [Triticum aestivum]|uniref:Uncharacterized protein n=2 Tax=Triticum aestivum TaxID=4565 RepID=A0A9R1L651_WHEAT|nr:hypothetical protein CFC21_083412 [Triticum aestivum]